MEFIGSIPSLVWKQALEISKKESFPVEQPETCPYVVLIHTEDNQLIALTGMLKRQHIDLFITEVFPPGEYKDRVILEWRTKHKANILAWQLISKALISFLHTSSIDK